MKHYLQLLIMHVRVVNRGKLSAGLSVSGLRHDGYWM